MGCVGSALGKPDCETEVPSWSGMFWVEDEFGYMSIHCCDEGQHLPPEPGWRLVSIHEEPEDDCEVFIYRRVTDLCVCRVVEQRHR